MDNRNRALLTERVSRSWDELREQALRVVNEREPAIDSFVLTEAVKDVDWETLRRQAVSGSGTMPTFDDEAMVQAIASVVLERVRARLPAIVREATNEAQEVLSRRLDERVAQAVAEALSESLTKPR